MKRNIFLKQNTLLLFSVMLSWVIPKKYGKVVAVSLHAPDKIEGHLRSLLQENKENPVLGDFTSLVLDLRGRKSLAYYFRLTGYIWQICRAQFLVVDSTRGHLAFGRFNLIQVWHGIGFKAVGVLNKNAGCVKRWMIHRIGAMTIFAIASSEPERIMLTESLAVKNCLVLGSPRLDRLISSKRAGALGGGHHFLYAPTRRVGSLLPPLLRNSQFLMELDAFLIATNSKLTVKLHPSDGTFFDLSAYSRIRYEVDAGRDVQDLLADVDLLISDYSSICVDYAILKRPIIWFVPDIEEFTSLVRDFYFKFPDVVPGPLCYSFSELFEFLSDLSWTREREYLEDFDIFIKKFHHFSDSRSSERVLCMVNAVVTDSCRP